MTMTTSDDSDQRCLRLRGPGASVGASLMHASVCSSSGLRGQGELEGGRNSFCHWNDLEVLCFSKKPVFSYIPCQHRERPLWIWFIYSIVCCFFMIMNTQNFALLNLKHTCAKASFSLLMILLGVGTGIYWEYWLAICGHTWPGRREQQARHYNHFLCQIFHSLFGEWISNA